MADRPAAADTSDAAKPASTAAPVTAVAWRRPLTVAYVVTFLTFFDTFALLPVMGPRAAEVGAGPVMLGAVVGAYSLSNLVTNPLAGVLLDRFPRGRLLTIGLTIAAVGVASYPLASSPAELLAVRLLHGVGGGIIVPAVFSLVGDYSSGSGRARAMGRTGAAIGTAAIVGPPTAGLLVAEIGFSGLTSLIAAVLVVALILSARGLPAPEAGAEPDRARAAGTIDRRRLLRAITGVFGLTFAVGGLSAFLPFRVEALGASPAVTGALLGLFAAVAAALMLSPLADQTRATSAARPLGLGLLTLAAALAGLAWTPTVPLAAAASALFGVGFALVFPTAATEASTAAPGSRRGRAFGVFHAVYSLGIVVGPVAAGAAVSAGSSPFSSGIVVALVCAAGVLALSRHAAAGGRRPR